MLSLFYEYQHPKCCVCGCKMWGFSCPLFTAGQLQMKLPFIHVVRHYLTCTLGGVEQAVEKSMAPHSNTLAWKIPWTEEPGRLQSMRSLRVRYDWTTSFSLLCSGEGNGNPLQYSCLENPRDGVAWWAAIYGVAQSWLDWSDLAEQAVATFDWRTPLSSWV